jgi:hypothetical protein
MPSSIRKALDELPDTLDDTYERILQNIPKQKWQHAHRLFQCMVVAVRPLRVEELAEVFAIGFGPNATPSLVENWRPENPEQAVFSACSTLITIIDKRSSKFVQFSHFSVKEYLTSDRLQSSDFGNISRFSISLEPAHTILARACLAVLFRLEKTEEEEWLTTFPLAIYAVHNWIDHAKFENVASQIWDAMDDFFDPTKPHCQAWLRIHKVDFNYNRTPLHYAASTGFSGIVKHLIVTHGQDVNKKVSGGKTALHVASEKGHVDVAQVLLDCGADVNAQDDNSVTPLHWASWKGPVKFVQLLLEHGATVNETDYDIPPLHAAVRLGNLEIVRLLLDHGADAQLEIRDRKEGLTPLQTATGTDFFWYASPAIAQLLLDRGAERK